jgi:hypothetical protein
MSEKCGRIINLQLNLSNHLVHQHRPSDQVQTIVLRILEFNIVAVHCHIVAVLLDFLWSILLHVNGVLATCRGTTNCLAVYSKIPLSKSNQ